MTNSVMKVILLFEKYGIVTYFYVGIVLDIACAIISPCSIFLNFSLHKNNEYVIFYPTYDLVNKCLSTYGSSSQEQ